MRRHECADTDEEIYIEWVDVGDYWRLVLDTELYNTSVAVTPIEYCPFCGEKLKPVIDIGGALSE